MHCFEISSLTYRYPTAQRPALKNISLAISEGECVALMGANNSGKTTLCYALSGIVPLYHRGEFSGSVRVRGLETVHQTISSLSRHVGLVLQHPTHQLSGIRYTVFEEIAFGLENLGIPRDNILKNVTETLSLVGLSEEGDRSPLELSGGQQQRLAIAAVLAASPDILVLDEPTTFLDPQGVQDIFELLLKLKRKGKTIIFAEQKIEWIAEYADRIIALADGKIILSGSPAEVLTSPILQKIGLDWSRYTKAADLAKQRQLWPDSRPLPITFSKAVAGFSEQLPSDTCAD